MMPLRYAVSLHCALVQLAPAAGVSSAPLQVSIEGPGSIILDDRGNHQPLIRKSPPPGAAGELLEGPATELAAAQGAKDAHDDAGISRPRGHKALKRGHLGNFTTYLRQDGTLACIEVDGKVEETRACSWAGTCPTC